MELLDKPLYTIMTENPKSVHPNTIMTEVSALFETENFHHLPVIDEDGVCHGVISKSDYLQLQNKFTRLPGRDYDKENQRFFETLLASNVMTEDVVALESERKVEDAVEIFLKNQTRSVVVTEDGVAIGIVTPLDLIKYLYEEHWLANRY